MSYKVKVPMQSPTGPVEKEGTIVNFKPSPGTPDEYKLEDGTKLLIKQSVIQIVRIDGEFDNQGNPTYIVQTTQMIAVDSPESLKRK